MRFEERQAAAALSPSPSQSLSGASRVPSGPRSRPPGARHPLPSPGAAAAQGGGFGAPRRRESRNERTRQTPLGHNFPRPQRSRTSLCAPRLWQKARPRGETLGGRGAPEGRGLTGVARAVGETRPREAEARGGEDAALALSPPRSASGVARPGGSGSAAAARRGAGGGARGGASAGGAGAGHRAQTPLGAPPRRRSGRAPRGRLRGLGSRRSRSGL